MASLRQGYDEWVLNEPEEPEGTSDEEMAAFEEAEKKHQEEVRWTVLNPLLSQLSWFLCDLSIFARQFQLLEQQAARLSSTLGVGKLTDKKLASSLLGFLRNGIKFAFSSDDDGELVLGSRLSFLSILSK